MHTIQHKKYNHVVQGAWRNTDVVGTRTWSEVGQSRRIHGQCFVLRRTIGCFQGKHQPKSIGTVAFPLRSSILSIRIMLMYNNLCMSVLSLPQSVDMHYPRQHCPRVCALSTDSLWAVSKVWRVILYSSFSFIRRWCVHVRLYLDHYHIRVQGHSNTSRYVSRHFSAICS